MKADLYTFSKIWEQTKREIEISSVVYDERILLTRFTNLLRTIKSERKIGALQNAKVASNDLTIYLTYMRVYQA